LRGGHNEKICETQTALPATGDDRVNQFLSFRGDVNVGLRQPKGSTA
jgi:hypothetical protein